MAEEIEIERKWLVTKQQFDKIRERLVGAEDKRIQQRYLRQKECFWEDGKFVIQLGKSGTMFYLDAEEYDFLWGVNLRKYGVRIRKTSPSGELELTFKLPFAGELAKKEINITLPFDYNDLIDEAIDMDLARDVPTGYIEKFRFSGTIDDIHFDCDSFINRPFRVVEAEFNSEDEADDYEPDFDFVSEVTFEPAFANKNMAFADDENQTLKYRIEQFCESMSLEADILEQKDDQQSNKDVARRCRNISHTLKAYIGR